MTPQKSQYKSSSQPQNTNVAFEMVKAHVPFSQEAEEAVIGSVLVNPDAFIKVAAFLKPDDFFLLRNNYIWEALLRLKVRDDQIDYLTLIEELKSMGYLDGVGGEVYIIGLFRNTPTSVHAEAYGRLVERAAYRRRELAALDEMRGFVLNENMTIEESTQKASARWQIATRPVIVRATRRVNEALQEYFDKLEDTRNGTIKKRGVPTGYRDIDLATGGWQRGEVSIVAGRTGAGKTPFLVGSALNDGRLGLRSIIMSLERSYLEIVEIMISIETGIPTDKMRNDNMTDKEYGLWVEAMGRIGELPIYIIDADDLQGDYMTPQLMRSRVEAVAYEMGVDNLYLDYIQLMWAGEGFEMETPRNIAACAWQFKSLCKSLDCAGITASQYNRGLTKTKKRPNLNFLHGGSGLEKAASLVMHIYDDETKDAREIIVDKNRYGKQQTEEGELYVSWTDYCQKFGDMPKTQPLIFGG